MTRDSRQREIMDPLRSEQPLAKVEKTAIEEELASAYAANAKVNLEIAEEFRHVDQEVI